jgi:integrase/recombinase XerD
MNALFELLAEANLSENTKRGYAFAIRSFCSMAGDNPASWTPVAVRDWRQRLRADGVSTNRVNELLRSMKAMSNRWASFNLNPAFNFASPIDTVRVEAEIEHRRDAMTIQQAVTLVATCGSESAADRRDCAVITLGLRTGMRRSSMVRIDLDDINWATGVLDIWIKGNKRHVLPPLDQSTRDALQLWRQWLSRHGVTSGRLFRSLAIPQLGQSMSCGVSITADGIYKMVRKRARAAGLEHLHISPHLFRHTFVTWMKEMGCDDHVIAAYTGHIGNRMIAHYTDARQLAAKADAVRRIPDLGGGLVRR